MRRDFADRYVEATGPETLARWLSQVPDHVVVLTLRAALTELDQRRWPDVEVLHTALQTVTHRWKRSLVERVRAVVDVTVTTERR